MKKTYTESRIEELVKKYNLFLPENNPARESMLRAYLIMYVKGQEDTVSEVAELN